MRTIIVGDVHGCLVELRALIAGLAVRPADHLVFCGDLVDKGPDSPGVVRFVRNLHKRGQRLTLVEGNHEAKHRRFRAYEERYRATGEANPIVKGVDELRQITAALSPSDVAFLEGAVLYTRLAVSGHGDVLVVHAGVPPSIKDLPADDAIRKLPRRSRDRYEQVLRVRFVGPHGWMIALGAETEADVYWTERYDGRFGHVYFGHQPFMQPGPERSAFATGLDLGCVFGNVLCAAVLEPDQPPWFATEAAVAKYATSWAE